MEQWNKITQLFNKKKLSPECITLMYEAFPLMIRTQYAGWIDTYILPSTRNDAKRVATQESPQFIFQMLMEQIELDLADNIQLSGPYTQLKEKYLNNEEELIKAVRDILAEERTCIENAEVSEEELRRKGQDAGAMTPLMTAYRQLIPDLDLAMKTSKLSNDTLNLLSAMPAKIVLAGQQLQNIQREGNSERISKATIGISGLVTSFASEVETTLQHLHEITACMKKYMERTWLLIIEWKNEQKLEIASLAKFDASASNLLNDLCEMIGHLLSTALEHASRLKDILNTISLINVSAFRQKAIFIENNLMQLAAEHLQKIFVVDKQPNQILKISSGRSPKFSASVCILGGNSLGMKVDQQMTATAFLVRDNNLHHVMTSSEPLQGAAVTIKNSEQQFKFVSKVNKHWVQATFPSLELYSPQKKDERKENELVTDIKHAIVFTTTVTFRNQVYPLKAVSVPIVLVSQTSQDCMARGTLVWDAAFSSRDRVALEEPMDVEWKCVAKVLSAMFFEHTGRGLNESQLDFLAVVAFNEERVKSKSKTKSKEAIDAQKITRQQLLKDKMSALVDFSFWKWFQCCLTLVRDYVKQEWQNGWIHGFIGKLECIHLLKKTKELGTFILRFSQSEIEGNQKTNIAALLTVAVLETNPCNPAKSDVFFIKQHLEPKYIYEHKLGPLLYAYEVKSILQPGVKKQLLQILYPNRPLPDLHPPPPPPPPPPTPEELAKRPNADMYLPGTLKVEIDLATGQGQANGLERSLSASSDSVPISPFSPAVGSVMSPGESSVDPMSPEPSIQSVIESEQVVLMTEPNGVSFQFPPEFISQLNSLEIDFQNFGTVEDQTWRELMNSVTFEDLANSPNMIANGQHLPQSS